MSTPTIVTAHLMTIRFDVNPIADLGPTPSGHRRIATVSGGQFTGERLRGTVMPSPGGDWLLIRTDGVLVLDVRVTLKTHDEHLIYMTYRGMRHGPKPVIDRLNRGEAVDPSEYYFRTTPSFETGSDAYSWLNRIVCVGTGRREPTGPVYDVFEVL